MRCFTDDAITELAMKHAAGEAVGERERAHLDSCEGCHEAFARESATVREVRRALRTAPVEAPGPCLGDNDLTEYLEGVVEAADLQRVEAHLARCRKCVANLVALDALWQASDTALSPVRYAIRVAKKSVEFLSTPDKGFRVSAMQYAPTLKESPDAHDLCAWSQNVDGHPLHFELQSGERERIHLTVTVDSRSIDPAKTHVTLRRDGDLIQSEPLGADRLIKFGDLRKGKYGFEINAPNELELRIEVELE